MCMIETKIYRSSSGTEWEREIAHPCKHASSNRLCVNAEHRKIQAGLVERRHSSSSRRPTAQKALPIDSENRSASRRHISSSERLADSMAPGYLVEPRSPASSTTSSSPRRFPAAPSPPPPAYRHIQPSSSEMPPRSLPMMSGGLGSEDGALPYEPSYDFISDAAQVCYDSRPPPLPKTPTGSSKSGRSSKDKCRKVSIELPAGHKYDTPTLSAPPLRRKSMSISQKGHKRVDSGKAFSPIDQDRLLEEAQRAAREDFAQYREQKSRERDEARMDAIQRRQEAVQESKQLRNELRDDRHIYQQNLLTSMSQEPNEDIPPRERRQHYSVHRTTSERRRLATEAAAQSARRKAERVQRAESAERDRERRLQAEVEAASRERHEADARRHSRDWALQRRDDNELMQTYNPRRPSRGLPIIHYDDQQPLDRNTSTQYTRGMETIADQQARLARDELPVGIRNITLEDPFAYERNPSGEVEPEAARLGRMRRYRDDRRQYLGL